MKIVKEIHIEEAEYNALFATQRLFIELHQEGVYNPDECINIIDSIEDFLSNEDVRIPHLLERGNEEAVKCPYGVAYNDKVSCDLCLDTGCGFNPNYEG